MRLSALGVAVAVCVGLFGDTRRLGGGGGSCGKVFDKCKTNG